MTPEFRKLIFEFRFLASRDKKKERCIPHQLQRLFCRLAFSSSVAASTKDLTKSFGWTSAESFTQHDIQELNRVLFDALEKVLDREPSGLTPIQSLYEGEYEDLIDCTRCAYASRRSVKFGDLSLDVRSDLRASLRAYITPERLEGDNAYQCSGCMRKVPADKGFQLTTLPPILTLQIKRFTLDWTTLQQRKINDQCAFPLFLQMGEYLGHFENEPEPDPPTPPRATYGGYGNTYGGSSYGYGTYSYGTSNAGYGSTRYNMNDQDEDDSDDIPATGTGAGESRIVPLPNDGDADGNTPHVAAEPEPVEEEVPVLGINPSTVPEAYREYFEFPEDADRDNLYALYAILIHSGTAMGGHYYSYIRDLETNQWSEFNDSRVSELTNPAASIVGTFGSRSGAGRGYGSYANAYLLVYRKYDLATPFPTRASLPEELQEELRAENERVKEAARRAKEAARVVHLKLSANLPIINKSLVQADAEEEEEDADTKTGKAVTTTTTATCVNEEAIAEAAEAEAEAEAEAADAAAGDTHMDSPPVDVEAIPVTALELASVSPFPKGGAVKMELMGDVPVSTLIADMCQALSQQGRAVPVTGAFRLRLVKPHSKGMPGKVICENPETESRTLKELSTATSYRGTYGGSYGTYGTYGGSSAYQNYMSGGRSSGGATNLALFLEAKLPGTDYVEFDPNATYLTVVYHPKHNASPEGEEPIYVLEEPHRLDYIAVSEEWDYPTLQAKLCEALELPAEVVKRLLLVEDDSYTDKFTIIAPMGRTYSSSYYSYSAYGGGSSRKPKPNTVQTLHLVTGDVIHCEVLDEEIDLSFDSTEVDVYKKTSLYCSALTQQANTMEYRITGLDSSLVEHSLSISKSHTVQQFTDKIRELLAIPADLSIYLTTGMKPYYSANIPAHYTDEEKPRYVSKKSELDPSKTIRECYMLTSYPNVMVHSGLPKKTGYRRVSFYFFGADRLPSSHSVITLPRAAYTKDETPEELLALAQSTLRSVTPDEENAALKEASLAAGPADCLFWQITSAKYDSMRFTGTVDPKKNFVASTTSSYSYSTGTSGGYSYNYNYVTDLHMGVQLGTGLKHDPKRIQMWLTDSAGLQAYANGNEEAMSMSLVSFPKSWTVPVAKKQLNEWMGDVPGLEGLKGKPSELYLGRWTETTQKVAWALSSHRSIYMALGSKQMSVLAVCSKEQKEALDKQFVGQTYSYSGSYGSYSYGSSYVYKRREQKALKIHTPASEEEEEET
eukprot:gnl/Dysnectes_brevis/1308_a1464_2015.p1 GENE.gnl/Dysnectes_brevis/1308_a1464_2015~~gnl/Dysnectes_brevis/1308_a1464_2015.p1  ORF type:complete len:1292 (-),score=598.81 gnl/Dysnectes_brevis/1308_a1464_2015:59-3778(-)